MDVEDVKRAGYNLVGYDITIAAMLRVLPEPWLLARVVPTGKLREEGDVWLNFMSASIEPVPETGEFSAGTQITSSSFPVLRLDPAEETPTVPYVYMPLSRRWSCGHTRGAESNCIVCSSLYDRWIAK